MNLCGVHFCLRLQKPGSTLASVSEGVRSQPFHRCRNVWRICERGTRTKFTPRSWTNAVVLTVGLAAKNTNKNQRHNIWGQSELRQIVAYVFFFSDSFRITKDNAISSIYIVVICGGKCCFGQLFGMTEGAWLAGIKEIRFTHLLPALPTLQCLKFI